MWKFRCGGNKGAFAAAYIRGEFRSQSVIMNKCTCRTPQKSPNNRCSTRSGEERKTSLNRICPADTEGVVFASFWDLEKVLSTGAGNWDKVIGTKE